MNPNKYLYVAWSNLKPYTYFLKFPLHFNLYADTL